MTDTRKSKRLGPTGAALGIVTALAVVAGIAVPAMASEQGEYGQSKTTGEIASPGQSLSMEQIVARLKEQGFKDIYEVERERGAYEVKAHTPEGGTVKLYVDPRTGDVLRHKLDD